MNKDKFLKEKLANFHPNEQRELLEYLDIDEPIKINITENYDIGEKRFAVHFDDWSEFWLDSFLTEKEAIEFCLIYQMELKNIFHIKQFA